MDYTGDVDKRLNPEAILPRLLKKFKRDEREGDNYEGYIDEDENYVITNNGTNCVSLYQPYEENGKYYLDDVILTKCSERRGNGAEILRTLIDFGKKYHYDFFNLSDLSALEFFFESKTPGERKIISVSLALYKILTIGNTWYSEYGFENEETLKLQTFVPRLISNSFENLLDECSAMIHENKKIHAKDRDVLIHEILHNVTMNLSWFDEIVANISENTSIKKCFTDIFKHIYTMCPRNACDDERSREVIIKMKHFMNYVFCLLLFVGTKDAKILTHELTPNKTPENIQSFVNTTLMLKYKNLRLNLALGRRKTSSKRSSTKSSSKSSGKNSSKRSSTKSSGKRSAKKMSSKN